MNDNFESSLGQVSEEMLKYIGVTNLDFRTSLSKDDLEEVQRLLFSMNTLMQVTFKDGVGVDDIENIKHLIELSPMCDDRKIEKMILKKNNPVEVKKLLSMPFLNPDTWHIAYDVKDETYMITTLPNYRVMEEYINIVLSCIKKDMTTLEKIKEVYDFVKLLEYDSNGSYRLPDIINNRKTNSLGFNLIFKEILNRLEINSYIGEISRSGVLEYLTIIDIEDSKYELSGIYVFDPSSDSIPKELYKSDAIRKVNYNFFCLSLNQVINTKEEDKLLGVLTLLNGDSFEYFDRKLSLKEKKSLEDCFGYSYKTLFEKVKKTKEIKEKTLLEFIFNTIHEEDFLGLNRNIRELLSNSYFLRKKEIFKEEKNTNLNKISIHDI